MARSGKMLVVLPFILEALRTYIHRMMMLLLAFRLNRTKHTSLILTTKARGCCKKQLRNLYEMGQLLSSTGRWRRVVLWYRQVTSEDGRRRTITVRVVDDVDLERLAGPVPPGVQPLPPLPPPPSSSSSEDDESSSSESDETESSSSSSSSSDDESSEPVDYESLVIAALAIALTLLAGAIAMPR